jgi:pimeloyl-ACP methyl ester carboxylesterase
MRIGFRSVDGVRVRCAESDGPVDGVRAPVSRGTADAGRAACEDRDAGDGLRRAQRPGVPLANAEFLAARLRHSRLVTFTAGHFVWEQQPELFAKLLGDWIDERNATDGGS